MSMSCRKTPAKGFTLSTVHVGGHVATIEDSGCSTFEDALLYALQRSLRSPSRSDIVTYTKTMEVKAGECACIPHDTDLILSFSGEGGAVPKIDWCSVYNGLIKPLNSSDVKYITPIPLRRMNFTDLFVSCDVDTTITILCGVITRDDIKADLHRHVLELEDGTLFSNLGYADTDLTSTERSEVEGSEGARDRPTDRRREGVRSK